MKNIFVIEPYIEEKATFFQRVSQSVSKLPRKRCPNKQFKWLIRLSPITIKQICYISTDLQMSQIYLLQSSHTVRPAKAQQQHSTSVHHFAGVMHPAVDCSVCKMAAKILTLLYCLNIRRQIEKDFGFTASTNGYKFIGNSTISS